MVIKDKAGHLAQEAAYIFTRTAKSCIERNGRFTVAVSGGATPRPMHRLLAEEPCRSDMPWDKTNIFWVDERCVPADDFSSNYGALKKDLLDRVPGLEAQTHPMPGALDPEEGALRYQEHLVDYFHLARGEFPIFDLIFLGLGRDGHTASLFPGDSVLDEETRLVVTVRGGDPDVDRLTMTFPVLNRAEQIIFLVSGKEKAVILKTVLESSPGLLPAQKIRPVNGMLMWLSDQEAAAFLSEEMVHDTLQR